MTSRVPLLLILLASFACAKSGSVSESQCAAGDWQTIGHDIPLLVDMQPAGRHLGEGYYRAGGLPAVMHALLEAGKGHPDALTVNGRTIGENCAETPSQDHEVIRTQLGIEKILSSRIRYQFRFLDENGELCAEGSMTTACATRDARGNLEAASLPQTVRERLEIWKNQIA